MSAKAADVFGVGMYTIPEAGRYVGRHFNTVRSWVHQGLAPAPVHRRFGETTILSFHDLVSLLVVRGLRDKEVSLRQIRTAELYLRKEWGFSRPFATKHILTDGRSVLVALGREGLTAVDRWGQGVFERVVEHDLVDVSYDASRIARAWRPYRDVVLQPDVQFGQPCVEGTRITTSTIFGLLRAGDSEDFLGATYGLSAERIRHAAAWENSLLRQAA